MNNLEFLLCLMLISSHCLAVEIKCHHQRNSWTSRGPLQECLVEDLMVASSSEVVETLNKHDYLTIKSFFIHKSPLCLYLPIGIERHLEHLSVLIIAGTGLKSIKQSDLKPFSELKELYLNDNHLESLEGDLFLYNNFLTEISFNDNFIKQVGFHLLEPLKNLGGIGFKNNVCIDRSANEALALVELRVELREKCRHPEDFSISELQSHVSNKTDCETNKNVYDLERKIFELETELNKTFMALTETKKDFCGRFNDWENEKCQGVEVESTTKLVHSDDHLEDYIVGIE